MSNFGSVVDHLLQTVDVNAHLQPFMGLSGWTRVDVENPHWWIWHGPPDAHGELSELVFPINARSGERRQYNIKALELLAFLANEPLERLLQRVLNYDRDLLFLRNFDTNLEEILSFDRVVEQLASFKQVLLHAVSAERDSRPFVSQVSEADRSFVRDYSFNHTMPGSFVFAVGTPRLRLQPEPHTQSSYLPDYDHPLVRPLVRRVSERIARGLQASANPDVDQLVEKYRSGFNANMCISMAEVAGNGANSVEFQIAWSPRLPAAVDVATFKSARIGKTTCDALIQVANKLKRAQPELAVIMGHITGLVTTDDPDLDIARRDVYLQGINPETSRQARFVLVLGREDYPKAIDAHQRWRRVRVTGYPTRTPEGWQLLNPTDFALLE